MRKAILKRKTKETEIIMKLNINGCGDAKVTSKIGFLNHMIESFAQHEARKGINRAGFF